MHKGKDPNGILQTRCALQCGVEKCSISPGPHICPLTVGSVLSAQRLHWEPSLPTGSFHCAIAPLLSSTQRQGTNIFLHLDSLLHVTIRTSFIRRCHFFGLECWAVWKVSLRNRFLPNPAQAPGYWGKSTAGIAFRLLSEVFLPTSTTTAQFLL